MKICLLSRREGEDLRHGVRPNCSNHSHISPREAYLLTADNRETSIVYGENNLPKDARNNPFAEWCVLENGNLSRRHIMWVIAREWQAKRMAMQWLPLGATKKRNVQKIKIERGFEHSSAWDNNQVQSGYDRTETIA